MATGFASGEIAASADALYALLADFGNVGWMQGVTKFSAEGEGVGMKRFIYAGDGDPVVEELELLDPEGRRVGYTIGESLPFPMKAYHSVCKAVDLGSGRSRLEWGCEFEPDGAEEAAVVAQIEGMYGVMIGWVRSALEG